ncbi:Uncharacterised protein [Mycobacteroides abscessus subsp. abscessus]|nr:Uncharacterised protein [Mycobacteroides abscessus subsp. abscessus]
MIERDAMMIAETRAHPEPTARPPATMIAMMPMIR